MWFVLLMLFFTACVETASVSKPPAFPRATLPFTVETISYTGTAVVQRRTSQKITATIPKGTPYFFISTCHREIPFDNPGTTVTYTYIPVYLLENSSSCLTKMTAISPQGVASIGFIDFTSEEDLPYRVHCNGLSTDVNGVSFCQSRAGLIQKVSFTKTTVALQAQGCEPMGGDGFSFTFSLSPGLCIYAFKSGTQYGRLTTYGYTDL